MIEYFRSGFGQLKGMVAVLFFLCCFTEPSRGAGLYSDSTVFQKELSFIEHKYRSGYYEEAGKYAVQVLWKLEQEKAMPVHHQVTARLLLVRIYEARLLFEKSKILFEETTTLPGVSSDPRSCIYIGEYLAETGRYLDAGKWHEKETTFGSMTEAEKLRYELLKAEILLGKGYILSALEALLEQEPSWQSLFPEKTPERTVPSMEHKDRYAHFLIVKTKAYILNGQFEEARATILYTRKWISSHIGTSSRAYTTLLETEILLYEAEDKPEKIAGQYANAYFSHPASGYEEEKIYLLCKTAEQSLLAGDLATYSRYQRKLQMNADRYAGKTDLSYFAYEYIQAFRKYREKDYNGAIVQFEQLLDRFSFLPATHPFRLLSESRRTELFLKSWRLSDYEKSLKKNIQQQIIAAGEESPSVDKAKLWLAVYEITYGNNYKRAEDIFNTSYTQRLLRHTGKHDPDRLLYLYSLGELYYKTARYDSALVKAGELQSLTRHLFGEQTIQYTQAAARTCLYQLMSGHSKEALEIFPLLLQQEKSLPGSDFHRTQRIGLLYQLSEIARLTGEPDLSRKYTQKSMSLLQYAETAEALEQLNTWEQLASLYIQMGNYYKAESLLKKSYTFKLDKLESDSPLLLSAYAGLSRLYTITGNYGEADRYLRLFSGQTEIRPDGLLYSESLFLYGDYYVALGDFKKAEEKYQQALRLQSSRLGENHLLLASGRMKLATVASFLAPEKKKETEQLYRQAGKIIEEAIGTSNALYAEYLQKTAAFLISTGNYPEAQRLLTDADQYWTVKLGASNRYSADIAVLRGGAYYRMEEYREAEKQYEKGGKMYAEIFSRQHPLYASVTGKTARVYYMLGDLSKSFKTMEEIVPLYLEYTEKYFPSLSFSEKEKFWNTLKEEFEFYNFLTAGHLSASKPQLNGRIYDQVIATKALLLSSDIKLRQRISGSGDTTLMRLFEEWTVKKELITSVLSIPKEQLREQGIDLQKETEAMEHLERTMSNRSSLFEERRKKLRIRWQDIRDELKENEYAVELIRFRYFNKEFTDSVIYGALILHQRSREYPELILMPDGRSMEQKYLKYHRNAAVFNVHDDQSYEAFWKPVKENIRDHATVYLSCEGVYNQLNLEMIPLPGEEGYVLDKNELILVTNTKDLLNKKENKNTRTNTWQQEAPYIFCGNPVFHKENTTAQIPSLPGAEQEVRELDALLKKSGKKTFSILNGQVTEDTLKKLNSPKVFHIATHGYFSEERTSTDKASVTNPLLHSGLILCEGGDLLHDSRNAYINSRSGILTAYEAINLNFDHTRLVVLSACETGRGEVQTGEGVFGLQRSFLIAGTDAVVMSLFKVNDEVTRKFMLVFYENLVQTGDKRSSFRMAKKVIKEEYLHPVYWGAFIMIEAYPKMNERIY